MSKSESSTKYNKENTKTYLLRCNIKTDHDVIQQIEKQENKNGYIKGLILTDYHMKKFFNKYCENSWQ